MAGNNELSRSNGELAFEAWVTYSMKDFNDIEGGRARLVNPIAELG